MTSLYFDESLYPEEAAALAALPATPGARTIGIDLRSPADGLSDMIGARRAGLTCVVFPILGDPFEGTLATIFRSLSSGDAELRSQQLAALSVDGLLVNETKPSEFASVPSDELSAASLALRLADIVLLGAPGERQRWNTLLQHTFRRFEILPVVPALPSGELDSRAITIFAPTLTANDIDVYRSILAHRNIPVVTICAANPTERIHTRVVLTPEWRPMRARALAAAGYHVAAPNTTGVDTLDSRIFGYAPQDHRGILDACDAAFAAADGGDRILLRPTQTAENIARTAQLRIDGPRISVIVRTFDRPALLARAIRSIADQTYQDIEIVVVNNGGEDVRDIVEGAAAGRLVRYERMPERKRISAASNVGGRVASGDYIGYLDDDDLLYGDHCSRTIEALARTGADLAFTLCLGEYAKVDGDIKEVLGYQVYLDRVFHPDDIYITNITPIHSIVHRRSVFERFGYFDEQLPVTDDWELWLRVVSGGGRLLRIDRVTCEYSWRYDPKRGNMTIEHQNDFVEAYKSISARYARDVAARPSIHAQQHAALAAQEERARGAADPQRAAAIVIAQMSETMVPVSIVRDVERA